MISQRLNDDTVCVTFAYNKTNNGNNNNMHHYLLTPITTTITPRERVI